MVRLLNWALVLIGSTVIEVMRSIYSRLHSWKPLSAVYKKFIWQRGIQQPAKLPNNWVSKLGKEEAIQKRSFVWCSVKSTFESLLWREAVMTLIDYRFVLIQKLQL